jgi:hypothetical protein
LPFTADASAGTLYRQMLGPVPVVAVMSSRYRLTDADRFALDVEKLGRWSRVVLEQAGDSFRVVGVERPTPRTADARFDMDQKAKELTDAA